MFAIIAAILFGFALLLDLIDADLGGTITSNTLVLAGFLCVALHLAGAGTWGRSWRSGGYVRRRR